MTEPGKLLPASEEAERAILGAILLDNKAYKETAEGLRPEDFSLDSHRRIYSRMTDLAKSSRPIDMITLVDELDRRKELEAIGDVGYVSGLVDGVPDRPSIEHYIRIVTEKALLRKIILTSQKTIERAWEGGESGEQVLAANEAAIRTLTERNARAAGASRINS
jgi:replicative DNA helicase